MVGQHVCEWRALQHQQATLRHILLIPHPRHVPATVLQGSWVTMRSSSGGAPAGLGRPRDSGIGPFEAGFGKGASGIGGHTWAHMGTSGDRGFFTGDASKLGAHGATLDGPLDTRRGQEVDTLHSLKTVWKDVPIAKHSRPVLVLASWLLLFASVCFGTSTRTCKNGGENALQSKAGRCATSRSSGMRDSGRG